MTAIQQELAREIRSLAAKLSREGWDRLRGVRLAHAAHQVFEESKRTAWAEAGGRASTLVEILGGFVQEAPHGARLAPVIAAAVGLADLLEGTRFAAVVDRDNLPAHPEHWRFVLAGELPEQWQDLADALDSLGFQVALGASDAGLASGSPHENVILLASASWLDRHEADAAAFLHPPAATPRVLVALADTNDFRVQVKARTLGARLLLEIPLDVQRLVSELAGLAWVPRSAYRVLLVDDDRAVLDLHAGMLKSAGFEVLAMEDPVAARDFISEFAPEVCVLDVEMPACRGTDLAALLRRDKRYARLPVIYVSAFGDLQHQLDARNAGGEDYLVKPVDPRLLVTAILSRARQFRLFEATYRQRRQAWRHLDSLRTAIDAHSIVSIAAADGTILDVNAKFCEISGYEREELIGRNHRLLKSGHHPPAFFEAMWCRISAGQIWQGELKNRARDGRQYWVQSTIVPVLDAHGLPGQFISIRTEITEQKRMQAEQERQSRLLDLLRGALQNFISSQDLATTSALLLEGLLLLTDSAFGFIGEVRYAPDGTPYLKKHAISDVALCDGAGAAQDPFAPAGMEFGKLDSLFGAVLTTGDAVIANDTLQDLRRGGQSAGHPRLDAMLGMPIRSGGKLVGMAGMANRPGGYDQDMLHFLQAFAETYAAILEGAQLVKFQRLAVDDLQRARDNAEQANQARVVFLDNWTRELRAPLNAILGHAQILQLHGELDEQTRQQVDEIAQGGRICARSINALAEQIAAPPAPHDVLPGKLQAQQDNGAPRRRILVAEDNPANQAVLRMQLGVLGFEADIAADGAAAMARWQAGGHALILADRHMPGMDGLELARAIRARERESGAHLPIIAITAVQHPEELVLCLQAGMDDTLPKPIELDDLRGMLERWLGQASSEPRTPQADRPVDLMTKTGATLDLDYLARIVGNADVVKVRELVDLFTVTVRADLPACHRHVAESNGRALGLVMHRLKSSARMVGALRFAGLAEALEAMAKAGQLNEAARLLPDIARALDDVEASAGRFASSPMPTLSLADKAPWDGPLPGRVLVVDDDPVARRQLGMLLGGLGVLEVLSVEDVDGALGELANGGMDLIISDLNMPGMDGVEFLRRLADNAYQGDLILCSGVEESLLQSAAEFAHAKGLSLRGSLKKPVARAALLGLLTTPFERRKTPSREMERSGLSPDDILGGIRRDEFTVHYQPKVDAATLKVVGVEALARWQRQGQSVPPDVFITVAERSGLIEQLSEVLITKALVGLAQLEEAGFPLAVAVNVSANWLSNIRLPDFIMASIQATGCRAENLILEITETGVMADMATALDVMSRLRLKGFKLSIDDFGTGYSSLEQLQRFPFGELKLDRSFVQGAAEKPAARAILASTLELATKLHLSTVAEGVETQAELDLVRGLGCTLVQGWFIAKAMPLTDLIEWLRARE